jgi:hypothetical protein
MNSSYIYLLIFACIAYLIVTDNNIAAAVTLLLQLIKFQFEKTKWIVLNDPRNPIVKYLIYKKSLTMAEQLIKEFENKSK